jgi:hypothetical protein
LFIVYSIKLQSLSSFTHFILWCFLSFCINFVHPVIHRLIQAKTSSVDTVSVDLFFFKINEYHDCGLIVINEFFVWFFIYLLNIIIIILMIQKCQIQEVEHYRTEQKKIKQMFSNFVTMISEILIHNKWVESAITRREHSVNIYIYIQWKILAAADWYKWSVC